MSLDCGFVLYFEDILASVLIGERERKFDEAERSIREKWERLGSVKRRYYKVREEKKKASVDIRNVFEDKLAALDKAMEVRVGTGRKVREGKWNILKSFE